jgi:alpha-methylacyl-CoA racemase
MAGPLSGIRIIEMAGIGPGPFCAMMLSDMGAEVIRIDRKPQEGRAATFLQFGHPRFDVLSRGRKSLALDLKNPQSADVVLRLAQQADALIEGFRPGVMERLGLGPEVCLARNPRLVYGRMTGWGQTGPLAPAAGHDLNYIALSGALHAIGSPAGPPTVPLNLVGDFGGGAMMLAFGLVAALLETTRSGQGQVIDAAITDGAALLSTMMYGFHAAGLWSNARDENLLDGAAHFYDCYACADGKFITVGALEPQFYALLLERCGIDDPAFKAQMNRSRWPELKQKLTELFRTRTRAEWCALMEGSDVCFAPVLDWDEAPQHAHNRARGTFVEIDGVTQPAPAPRFSRTPPEVQRPPAKLGEHGVEILGDWGFAAGDIEQLQRAGVI